MAKSILKKIFTAKRLRNATQVIGGSGIFTIFIFATPTITAPNIGFGIILSAILYLFTFLALYGLFKKQGALKAIEHMALATLVAFPISIILGIFWTQQNLETLLSPAFFTTVSHIAFHAGVFSGSIADATKKE